MITCRLIDKIKKHKGKLYAPVFSTDDCIHVAVEKKDLLIALERFLPLHECGYHMYQLDDGTWCIGAEH